MSIKLEEMFSEIRYPSSINTAKDFTSTGTITGATVTGTTVNATTLTASGAVTLGTVTQKSNVLSGQASNTTLTAAQSGSLVLFDRGSGIIYTLPAPSVGLYYDFATTVSVVGGSDEVLTDAGTTFLLGSVDLLIDASSTHLAAAGNGTSHVRITSQGTTRGGLKGSQYRVVCVSSTQWNVTGLLLGSGALATPFST